MKKILLLVALCFAFCGCNNESNKLDIKKIMAENEHIIVDVRTAEEYRESHVIGSINIPYDQIQDNLDKNKIIFVYCRSGARSKIAFDTLKKFGYNVYDLGAFSQINLPKE